MKCVFCGVVQNKSAEAWHRKVRVCYSEVACTGWALEREDGSTRYGDDDLGEKREVVCPAGCLFICWGVERSG